MTAHDHSTFQDWCYRCHLSRDEAMDALFDTLNEMVEAFLALPPDLQAAVAALAHSQDHASNTPSNAPATGS